MPHGDAGAGPGREEGSHPFYSVCRARGHCGPFLNQTYYDSLSIWRGFGDCAECGCTVPIPRSLRGLETLGRLIEGFIPPGPRRRDESEDQTWR